jgi:hypothetical protein
LLFCTLFKMSLCLLAIGVFSTQHLIPVVNGS